MSIMLESPEIFSEEDMIDEIVDFLAAGHMTTASAAAMMVC